VRIGGERGRVRPAHEADVDTFLERIEEMREGFVGQLRDAGDA
jgi:hypothetical protein